MQCGTISRTRRPLGNTYPELVDALTGQASEDFIIDGGVVAFERSRTSFARLQQRIGITDPDHRIASGEAYFAHACATGWEGLVAKRASSTYVSRRSPDWLKLKCSAGQEFVVGGFTEPSGSRVGLGALLVGYYDGDDFVYAGKVGTGFSQATLRDLHQRLGALEIAASPFARGRVAERGVHWVEPELVAQIVFTGWTGDGKLRHPRFEGLRQDKMARDVVRERPARGHQG